MIYEPPTIKEDDCSPWSCKTIKWADDVIPNLCSPVLHNDDIDKRCDDIIQLLLTTMTYHRRYI